MSTTTGVPSARSEVEPMGSPLVAEVMHRRVVSCAPETPLRTVARMMSTYRIHSVIVHDDENDGRRHGWVVVSDRDVAAAVAAKAIDHATAGSTAATEFVTTTPSASLHEAARLLHEHDVAHLVVVDRISGRPLGVLSTLDIARAVGGDG